MAWIQPRAVFQNGQLLNGQAVEICGDHVKSILPADRLKPKHEVTEKPFILAPGLLDLQVNGGGGVMLNDQPTRESVRKIAAAHRQAGTAFIFPTIMTDRPRIMELASLAVLSEHRRGGILGLHIEGPHISPCHKGVHNPKFIRPLDDATIQLLTALREKDLPVLLTLAPESVPAGSIARLTRMGVVVSGGHSGATASQTGNALAEGLAAFTHLFNGMPPMTSRNPGIVAAALASNAYCAVIADGHHVDHRMLALAVRSRPIADRMILVSDAMATVCGPDHFVLYGEKIRLKHGRLINSSGSLAGAHVDLGSAVANMIRSVGIPVENALSMATVNPRNLMRLPEQALIGSKLEELAMICMADRK